MKLIKEAKETTKDMIDIYKQFFTHAYNWELLEALTFYKQSIRDFIYASKKLFMWLIGTALTIMAIFILPFAIIFRTIKK